MTDPVAVLETAGVNLVDNSGLPPFPASASRLVKGSTHIGCTAYALLVWLGYNVRGHRAGCDRHIGGALVSIETARGGSEVGQVYWTGLLLQTIESLSLPRIYSSYST